MTIAISSPITGSNQSGASSPTYTVVQDSAAPPYTKRYAVTALASGTFANVDYHGASDPFLIEFKVPQTIRSAPTPNPNTGVIPNSPRNVTTVKVTKGVSPVTNTAPQPLIIRMDCSVPAGADTVEPEDIRAAVDVFIGALVQNRQGLAETLITALL